MGIHWACAKCFERRLLVRRASQPVGSSKRACCYCNRMLEPSVAVEADGDSWNDANCPGVLGVDEWARRYS